MPPILFPPTGSGSHLSHRPSADDRAVFEAAPDGILLVDSSGTIVRANPQALRLFGYEASELVGQPVEILVPAALQETHRSHRSGYVNSPDPRPMGIGLELEGVRRDGVRVPVEISLSPMRSSGADTIIAVVRDLTERKRLKGFGIAALNAAEEERRRIARELHDETAQSLAALLMELAVLEKRLGDRPGAEEISGLRARVTDIVDGVRRIARGLRPPELEDVGLAAALRSFARTRFARRSVELSFDGSESWLSPEQSLVVYRIAQEALSNAARHGAAQHVRLAMHSGESSDEIVLEIEDDGVGFDLARTGEAGGGLGLVGMEERAQIAGGILELDSAPGHGTRVRARIPVVQSEPVTGPGRERVEPRGGDG